MAAQGRSLASFLLNEIEDDHDNERDEIFTLVPIIIDQINECLPGHRMIDWVEKVLPHYRDDEFRRHFRLRRASFEKLCCSIADASSFQQTQTGGRPMVPIQKQVLVYLWYSSSKENLWRIADRFNITESATHRSIRRVMNAILEKLLKDLIKWPTGDRLRAVLQGFADMKGLEGACGAIDGSHIRISGKEEFKINYINRKNYPSINLQGVCDHQMLFTDAYAGWPGSVHDARVFANSDLKQRIVEDQMSLFPGNTFIIGDAAYRLETYLLTPYKGYGLNAKQTRYNYIHSASRMVIERAFGLLKSRFCRLQLVALRTIEDIVKLIMTC